MKLIKIMMGMVWVAVSSLSMASETVDCSGQNFEYLYLFGGVSKQIQSDLKGEAPEFIKELNKAGSMKGAAGTKAMKQAMGNITCALYGQQEENFLSMTFKNKSDRWGDYQVEFTPTGGYKDWIYSTKNKAPLCWRINVHKGGWYVKSPGTDDNYRIYALSDPFTKVVERCR